MKKEKNVPENALVQKSRPLFSLWKEKEKINLFEYKMLDMYLARINSHDPEHRTVRFSMDDMNTIMASHLTKAELHEKLKKLQGIVVSYGDDEAITLFEYSKIHIDSTHFDVQLMCTQTAHKYFFNIENIGYFKYKFRNVLAINSMYSYILFNYLEMNRFRNQPFEVDVDELKRILSCDSPTYNTFKRFNDLILRKCHKELTEKTELQFSYETVKKGRVVVAIKFDIAPLQAIDSIASAEKDDGMLDLASITVEDTVEENDTEFSEEASSDEIDERISFFSECFDNSFSPLQVQLLASSVNPDCIQHSSYGVEIDKFNYLNKMYKRLLVEEREKNIENRFRYLLTMIENDRNKDINEKIIAKKTDDYDDYDFFINKF